MLLLYSLFFSFGLISDVQYADIPDGRSFLGVPWYYRHSIFVLRRAVKEWNTHQKHKFAINFGDIVDGFCPKDQSLGTIKKVVDEFEISKTLDGRAYYDFSPVPEYRFVVLDGYDISAIGWPKDHPKRLEALKILREKNPNEDKNNPVNMEGLERRQQNLNRKWLSVAIYLPLDPGAASEKGLVWNYDEIMNLIHKYNCVKVCLAGHYHRGGCSIDSRGIHHRVLEAALECPPGTNQYVLNMLLPFERGKDATRSIA
ncbi:hypothetical protein JHK85_011023 [Glycine max]|nr:hypothetical protein JHK85_011023 [Glycine max]